MHPHLRKTPLYEQHRAANARMAPFAGFDMPIQYQGILAEHRAVREHAGIFDTCHMGEFRLTGSNATPDLERLLTRSLAGMRDGQCRYSFMCNERGGIVDDLLVYRRAANDYMLVVNASGETKDYKWIAERVSRQTTFENLSRETGKLDLQGPGSARLAMAAFGDVVRGLRYYRFVDLKWQGSPVILSRTGYTGELGYEIYADPATTCTLWDFWVDQGAVPAGLGARDTLRLEMGLPLYGHELSADRNANETGFTRLLATDKDFVGSRAVHATKPDARLAGLRLGGRQSARAGDSVLNRDGRQVGEVTSGSFAPSVGTAIALAYIEADTLKTESALTVRTARRPLEAVPCAVPFYREGTARDDVERHL